MPSPIISLENISKHFSSPNGQSIPVLQDISLAIEPNQMVSIRGESGCGKSTLLQIIGGLDRSSSGSIFWKEKCISGLSVDRLASLRQNFIGFIFQGSNLIPELTVLENILFPVHMAGKKQTSHRKKAQFLLQKLSISSLENRIPAALSGGERQRVAIARALILNPEVVIADEPTGNLDEKNAAAVMALLMELCKESHSSLILVTHSMLFAQKMERSFGLKWGKLSAHSH
ncbi:MAG: ABC transporter ATP-binding protein [Puniceicoccales bacterium]|jgi:ABC-type lipoprotein export system ATPase subunit|nr:ABC transporter ATP-binding protein [Puniceicoccales bacterium]